MEDNQKFTIRPAGRHVLTIGRELIQDSYAAIIELVKNAYDADSATVNIEFTANKDQSGYTVVISDHGHGMTRDVVINKWMVPSTDDKLIRKTSQSGKRTMQGRKGIGRYAASILGKDLLLETITKDGEKTTLLIEWSHFESADFLDEVEILIDTTTSNDPPGTTLTITGATEHLVEWDNNQFKKLRDELKKLKSPVYIDTGIENKDVFDITLNVIDFYKVENISETVEPYPIFELFDYKISGEINSDGKGILSYCQQNARNTTKEKIEFDLGNPTRCGKLLIDIRVYDREKESIDALIARGLKDGDTGQYVGKQEARALLNQYNGIGVYRNGFRIRPMGDAAFDWLKLNYRRVQNPSLCIGSNQVIGTVQIEAEEISGLTEKSARDGLKENAALINLRTVTSEVISKLEAKRFSYRKKAGISRSALKVERELERLFSFDDLKKGIRKKLKKGGISDETADEIVAIISKDAEDKNKIANEIRKAVAVYQGQATLGKIINVILHEGRRPLNYFKNQIKNLNYWHDSYLIDRDPIKFEKLLPIAEGIRENSEFFVTLFGRLDPLAAGKRTAKKQLLLKKVISDTSSVFKAEIDNHNVTVEIVGDENCSLEAWPQDIYAIFTNLIDNSIYWLTKNNSDEKTIRIDIVSEDGQLRHIDYRDSGPGIEPSLIESEVIFDPQFSTKPNGTGLGLAIAGESATRNNLELKAVESENGAYFRLQPAFDII